MMNNEGIQGTHALAENAYNSLSSDELPPPLKKAKTSEEGGEGSSEHKIVNQAPAAPVIDITRFLEPIKSSHVHLLGYFEGLSSSGLMRQPPFDTLGRYAFSLLSKMVSERNVCKFSIKRISDVASQYFEPDSVFFTVQVEGTLIQANRLFFISQSNYFRTLLEGSFLEARQSVITLEEVTVYEFSLLKQFFEEEEPKLPNLEEDSLARVMQIALRFDCLNLFNACEAKLKEKLTRQNLEKLIRISDELCAYELYYACLELINTEFIRGLKLTIIANFDLQLELYENPRIEGLEWIAKDFILEHVKKISLKSVLRSINQGRTSAVCFELFRIFQGKIIDCEIATENFSARMTWPIYPLLPLLTHCDFSASQLRDTDILTFLKCAKNLVYLDLSDCENLTDSTIDYIAANLPHLKTIILDNCTQFSSDCLQRLFTGCKQLNAVNLGHCVQVNDAVLKALNENSPNLQVLMLDNCVDLTDQSLDGITGNNLFQISLDGCDKFSNDAIQRLIQRVKRLRYLSLNDMPLNSETLVQIASHIPEIEGVAIRNAREIEDEAIAFFFDRCHSLVDLDLAGCAHLSQKTLGKIAYRSGLLRLDVSNCPKLDEEYLQELQNNWTEAGDNLNF